MNRINSSRQSVAASQRDKNYKPNYAIAQHVIEATTEIDSTEQVLFLDGKYYVSSKFMGRYYTCSEQDGVWACSSKDASVAKIMVAKAQAFAAMIAEMQAGMASIGERLHAKLAA